MVSAFASGITGYIGGSALVAIKSQIPDLEITTVVRHEKDVKPVEALGFKVVRADYADLNVIEKLASEADVLFNFASSDDVPLTQALLRGAKARSQKKSSEGKPILIHTSGTGLLVHGVDGKFDPSARVWNDANEEDIKSIPPEALHRDVDSEIFKANDEGYIDAYIVSPPTIHGLGTGPGNRISIQVPFLVRTAIARKQAFYIGEGTNVFDAVNVKDLSDFYVIVTKHALSGADKNSSYGRFYFVRAEEFSWGDLTKVVMRILQNKGVVPAGDIVSVPANEIEGSVVVAGNSRSVSDRAAALGWKPTTPSAFETIHQDVDLILSVLSRK